MKKKRFAFWAAFLVACLCIIRSIPFDIGNHTSDKVSETHLDGDANQIISQSTLISQSAIETKAPLLDLKTQPGVIYITNRQHDYTPSIPSGSASPRIPHIIHQTWDDHKIPTMFAKWIKTWKTMHPTWEYWLWTPQDVKLMLSKYYPSYLKLYSNYTEEIFKANIMRYFIMHKYGGIYADLDVESLRPMDNWTMDNDCILSENHHVHSYIVAQRDHANVMIIYRNHFTP